MKILVNIFVPAIAERYDVLIPDHMRIKTIIPLIAKTVESLSNHRYIMSGEESLCSVEANTVLNPNYNFSRYGIKNGDHLVML